jgi:hypothetical protein
VLRLRHGVGKAQLVRTQVRSSPMFYSSANSSAYQISSVNTPKTFTQSSVHAVPSSCPHSPSSPSTTSPTPRRMGTGSPSSPRIYHSTRPWLISSTSRRSHCSCSISRGCAGGWRSRVAVRWRASGVWVLWRRLRLRCWRGERWRLKIRELDFWEGYISLYLYTISAGGCMAT